MMSGSEGTQKFIVRNKLRGGPALDRVSLSEQLFLNSLREVCLHDMIYTSITDLLLTPSPKTWVHILIIYWNSILSQLWLSSSQVVAQVSALTKTFSIVLIHN